MLLDTHSWVDVLTGNPRALQIEKLVGERSLSTAAPTLSELTSWSLKNQLNLEKILEKVIEESSILPFSESIAKLAGRIHFDCRKTIKGFGMVDAMIYGTALENNLTLVTGDPHFKDLPNVLFIE
ncbi:MAG TPA: PIN domain-containing protein [Candidatus Norongarragalinales archaeon]|nr:PIN domain-containing protein [Candidatus Norongarragalinales archaeon]